MELLDYDTVRVIWWLLIGVLFIAFALTDGFDMGAAGLLPFVAKTDEERLLTIRTVSATWEGNQTWLITAAAGIFAAWPLVYAHLFPGWYLAMFLVLVALIIRPSAFKYRSSNPSPNWRRNWDWALSLTGLIPPLVFGVAVGNLLTGTPIRTDADLRAFYDGSLIGLFTLFPLLCGLLGVSMICMHGATWLNGKAECGPVTERATRIGRGAALATIVLFALGGCYVAFGGLGYRITSGQDLSGISNPLLWTTEASPGAWLANYGRYPLTIAAPVLGFVGAIVVLVGIGRGNRSMPFMGSSLSVIGIIATFGLSMFPFIVPSSSDPKSSLLVWNSSSSHLTLSIMMIMAVIFVPIILLYTTWVYRVMRGRVTRQLLADEASSY